MSCKNKKNPCSICMGPTCAEAVDGECDYCLERHAECILSATGMSIRQYKAKYKKSKPVVFCLRCEDKKDYGHECKDNTLSYEDILIDINLRNK